MSVTTRLDNAIKVVCPIYGVSIGRENDKTTWRIDFKQEATAQQRAAAQAVMAAFDPLVPTQAEQDMEDEAAITRTFDGDRIQRLIFEIEYDQENRIRLLEGRPPVSRATYRDALIARYKLL